MKNSGVLTLVVCCSILLTACETPQSGDKPTATATVATAGNEQCAYSWATQLLPDESARIQVLFTQANMADYQVKAVAYGENCVAGDGSLVSFSASETDIYVTVAVPNLQDRNDLGARVYALMQVLGRIGFALPGSNEGYLGVTFQQGDQNIQLWVPRYAASQAVADGLRGADLLDTLQSHK